MQEPTPTDDHAPAGLLDLLARVVTLTCLALLAIAGGLVVVVLVFGAPKYHGNEASAVGSLRTVITCQRLFREADRDGDGVADHADLTELSATELVDGVLGTGTKQGYLFTCRARPDGGWTATAAPVTPGRTGDRWFAVDEREVIHWSEEGPVALDGQGRVLAGASQPLGTPPR